jgi:hypothetical protein
MNDDALAKLMGFKDGDYTGGVADRERQAKIDAEFRKANEIIELPKVQQIHKKMLSNAIRNQQINEIDLTASDWCVCSAKSGALKLDWIYYVSLSTLEAAGFKPMEKETVVLRRHRVNGGNNGN